MDHKHTFQNESWIVWRGKIIKFCDDTLCLHYIVKGDDDYIYSAQRHGNMAAKQ